MDMMANDDNYHLALHIVIIKVIVIVIIGIMGGNYHLALHIPPCGKSSSTSTSHSPVPDKGV